MDFLAGSFYAKYIAWLANYIPYFHINILYKNLREYILYNSEPLNIDIDSASISESSYGAYIFKSELTITHHPNKDDYALTALEVMSGNAGDSRATNDTQTNEVNALNNAQLASTAPMIPLKLDYTDELILNCLSSLKGSSRLITSKIANRLDREQKVIGKNLSKLKDAGLIDNVPRVGYKLTAIGLDHLRSISSQT